MKRLVSYGLLVLTLCLSGIGCSDPTLAPTKIQEEMDLTIVYPQTSIEIAGGQSFRITAILKEPGGEPIEGASVEALLWAPNGELFARLSCVDQKTGRYLTDRISLPLRNSQGFWRITIQADSENRQSAWAEGQFIGLQSYSERLKDNFGFWIELTDLFPYNISNAEDPLLKTYSYQDGGYVILANNLRTTQINNSFIILDVHWRQMDFPENEPAAADYVLNLAGPHRISLDLSPPDLVAEKETFLGSAAWHVTGWWNPENNLGDPRPDAPLDWIIFRCPGTEEVWTVLITSNGMEYMDDLKSIRESFACSLD